MTARGLKLAIVCDNETDEMKSLNSFFDDLFSDLKIYTDGVNPDLIFMKGDKWFMQQDYKNGLLLCIYEDFWSILEKQYNCAVDEIQGIIQYKVEEAFKIGSLTPAWDFVDAAALVEEAFEIGSLTPYNMNQFSTNEVYKMTLLTPFVYHS